MAQVKKPDPKKAAIRPSGPSQLLDVFPAWSDPPAGEKEPTEKYDDLAGLCLPGTTQPFLDAWKRPEEMVQSAQGVPMVCVKPLQAEPDKKGKAAVEKFSRELEGKLYAGHASFEWMFAAIAAVISAEKSVTKGDYLWELIYPKDKDGQPCKSASGKYRIKLYLVDTWRAVTVDDRVPLDLFGRPLLVGMRPLQLWPLLLCKAILKVMAVYHSLDLGLHHQVAAFQMLTGWPQEDLLDSLSGTPLQGGYLFDRLNNIMAKPQQQQERIAISTCCLIKRSKPDRNPPRIIVLCGPSAVGRGPLMSRIVAEYPDKFAITISHTTRRPREHEVDGRDYYFANKRSMLSDIKSKKFLEACKVPTRGGRFWYGTSLATVREVAATGKLCIMGLDQQGAQALRSNKRIDGLYLYVRTSAPSVLSARQKQRLKEADSTIQKRLSWAGAQVAKAQKPGLFDNIVENTQLDQVYLAVKEAICTLSPIIRNRLRGLPAYVLDYSDLIPPNSVEKAFLKPVILAGPHTGERSRLLNMLVDEFPDVFALPRRHTTCQPDADSHHVATDDDDLMLAGSMSFKANRLITEPAVPVVDDYSLGHLVAVQPEAFDAAVLSGAYLEHHTELFTHPTAAHRYAVSMEDIKEVIKSGKLPLLDIEAEGAEAIRAKGVDCLTIFLTPPSISTYEDRLKAWLTETDEEIRQRQAEAEQQLCLAQASGVFDGMLVNDELEQCYQQLKAIITKYRPDIIPPDNEEAAKEDTKQQAATQLPVLTFCGPAGAGCDTLLSQLLERFPQRFAVPPVITDRKPGKGDKDIPGVEVVKAEALTKLMSSGGIAAVWDDESGNRLAVTLEAIQALTAEGKLSIIQVMTTDQVLAIKQGTLVNVFAVYTCRTSCLGDGTVVDGAASSPQLNQAMEQLAAARASGAYQAIVDHDDSEEAFLQLQQPLSAVAPAYMPALLQPLVVLGPFGSGKRLVLQQLMKLLPDVLAVPRVVTTHETATADMDVISQSEAQALLADDGLLVSQQVLGHVYGISAMAVKKLQTSGKLAVIDVDRVDNAAKLKQSGFQATYLYLAPPSLSHLQQHLTAEIMKNPPLGYEPEDAVVKACEEAAQEMAAAQAVADMFDATVTNNPEQLLATITHLSDVLHQHYPAVVPLSFVWGYGRALWDTGCRLPGQKQLKVILLGPAASGKSTQAELLADRFHIPLINAGDLLYCEVQAKTPLGLEAKQYMDGSKTVPDKYFMQLLTTRLSQPDCVASGWLLDGFPHTKRQALELASHGFVPDKVVFLEGPHNLLMDRVKYRRVDYTTGRVYHIAESGALSESVRPLLPDGGVDQDAMARLEVRHDDSEENVRARLRLWDMQIKGLREAFEDVSTYVPAAGGVREVYSSCCGFITLEADVSPPAVMPSHELQELTYMIKAGMRYQRRQLIQLHQLEDGKTFWVDLKELAPNSYCMLVVHNPALLPFYQQLKRLDTSSIAKQYMLKYDSSEPMQLVCCLNMGPQYMLSIQTEPPKQVLVLCGPTGSGRSSIARLLVRDVPDKMSAVARVTSRPPHVKELHAGLLSRPLHGPPAAVAGTASPVHRDNPSAAVDQAARGATVSRAATPGVASTTKFAPSGISAPRGHELLQFMTGKDIMRLDSSGALAECTQHVGYSYGTPLLSLQSVWSDGHMAVVVGPVDMVQLLKEHGPDGTQVLSVFLTADVETLDQRMRQHGTLDEQSIQHHLQDAARQQALVQQQPTCVDVAFDNSGELERCYSFVTDFMSRHWLPQQQHIPGLLLVQHTNATGLDSTNNLDAITAPLANDGLTNGSHHSHTAKNSSSNMANGTAPGTNNNRNSMQATAKHTYSSSSPTHTALRVRAITASSSTLQLPRGNHLLHVQANDLLIHASTFYSATDFQLEEATKLLPVMDGSSIVVQEGEHDTFSAGSRQLLFRYLLRSVEPCQLSLELRMSSSAAASCVQLIVVDNATRQTTVNVLNRIKDMQLAAQDKGYTILALAQPFFEVPAGSWNLQLSSSKPLPALQDLPVLRVANFDGSYSENAKGCLCRYILSPTAPVHVTLLGSIDPPTCTFNMHLYDTAGGKDISWTSSHKLLATISSSISGCEGGRVVLPSYLLPAGKYLLVMELDQHTSHRQLIHGVTAQGSSHSAPKWQLQVVTSADERVLPIVKDDSWDRYYKAAVDSWQQQAAATAAAQGGKAAAAVKDRPKQAQAALDRYLSETKASQELNGKAANTEGISSPAAVVRQLRDGSSLELRLEDTIQKVAAKHQGAALVIKHDDISARLGALQDAAAQDAALIAAMNNSRERSKLEIGALQARKASEFGEWRSKNLMSLQAAADQRAEALKSLIHQQQSAGP